MKEPIAKIKPEFIVSEGYRYTEILQDNLSYGQAMDLINEGKKVARSTFKGYWAKQFINGRKNDNVEEWFGFIIVAVLQGGGHAIAQPYQVDMLSNDWMEVR